MRASVGELSSLETLVCKCDYLRCGGAGGQRKRVGYSTLRNQGEEERLMKEIGKEEVRKVQSGGQ